MSIVVGEPESTPVQTGGDLQQAALILNGIDLMMTTPSADGYLIEASADGTNWGNPEAVISTVQSQLQDGSLELHERDENREASIHLRILAPDSPTPGRAIGLGQKALELACRWPAGQVRELRWLSPLAGAQTTVFEMTSATVEKEFDDDWDLGEVLHGERRFVLSLHARPFVRGTTPVTIEAPAVVGSTTEVVDDGSATTGWSMLSTAPAAIKNLMPNPSFEANTTGWAAGSGTTAIRRWAYSGGEGLTGAGSYKLFVDPASGTTQAYADSPAFAVTPNTMYTLSAYMNGNSGGADGNVTQLGILYRWYNSAGAQIGPDQTVTSTPTSTGDGFKRVFGQVTSPAGAATGRIFPFAVYGTKPDRVSFVIDAAQVSPGDVVWPYFDGSTANTAAITYAWDGAANNSTATGTWSAPTLVSTSGAVRGTVYGRSSAAIRRAGVINMATLQYMRIKGSASAFSDGQVTVADNGGAAITPQSYFYDTATGAYEILVKRPTGFTAVDVTFQRTSGTVSTTSGLFVAVDQIDITDNPYANGKVQSRQVQIYGSQRTELSLSVLGLDEAGDAPVALGDQVLVYTASAADDARAKFVACRSTAGLAGTGDASATSGTYNASDTIASGTYPKFTIPATGLLPGTYDLYASLQATTAATHTVSLRADQDAGLDAVQVGAWQNTDVITGATWPQIPTGVYRLVPVGTVTVPEGAVGTITLSLAASTGAQIWVDDLFAFHRTAGQLSMLDTKTASSSFSAVRLDAATVTNPKPSAWVGVANGDMIDAALAGRCQAFEQHKAEPGLLQIVTITPACSTSRVSATYFERFAHDAATVAVA